MTWNWSWAALCALVLTTGEAAAQDGGIEVFAGETLFEKGLRVSFTELYKPKSKLYSGANEVANPEGQFNDEYRSVLGVDYGFSRNLTLMALVPYVHRDYKLSVAEAGGDLGDQSLDGFGDVTLMVKHRGYHVEGRGRTFNLAWLAGGGTPTGETDARLSNGDLAPPRMQPGLGSWNPFLSSAMTAGIDRWRFDAVIFNKVNTKGDQDYEKGNFFSASVSVGYRFLHYKYPGPTFGERLGGQYRHEQRAKLGGALQTNSGSEQVLLNPGLSIHPIPRMDLNIFTRIPVYQDYNGTQLSWDPQLVLAFGFRF